MLDNTQLQLMLIMRDNPYDIIQTTPDDIQDPEARTLWSELSASALDFLDSYDKMLTYLERNP